LDAIFGSGLGTFPILFGALFVSSPREVAGALGGAGFFAAEDGSIGFVQKNTRRLDDQAK
jgi:hypothetical protein